MGTSSALPTNAEPRILGPSGAAYPPGPSLAWTLLSGKLLWQDPISLLSENARRFGDLNHFLALDGHVFQFNHPALVQELLTETSATIAASS